MLSNTKVFEKLNECRTELLATNSSNEKKEILARYPELIEILNYTYDSNKKYFITTKQLDKHSELCNHDHINESCDFYDMLGKLYLRQVTGYDAIAMVNLFISYNKEHEELIRLVLDKNLKCRIDAKLINKVFPHTVPVFEVALAKKFEEKMLKNWDWSEWIAMRKLDGIRCITKIDENGDARFFSRKGNEFFTLNKIRDEIKENGLKNMVLDGELCIVDEDGDEDFTAITKEYNRKNHTIENPKYIVFDQLTHEEFDSGESEDNYDIRLHPDYYETGNEYDRSCDIFQINWKYIEQILVYFIAEEDDFKELKERAAKLGWEGLILRKDVAYEGKRTKNLLKVKQFHDAEYMVEGIETGDMRVINKDTGLEETITTMSNVLITHKGFKVSVGSGFSIDQRKQFFSSPNDIIGKEITVKYFEESKNQNGGISLRFPTVKKIWESQRSV